MTKFDRAVSRLSKALVAFLAAILLSSAAVAAASVNRTNELIELDIKVFSDSQLLHSASLRAMNGDPANVFIDRRGEPLIEYTAGANDGSEMTVKLTAPHELSVVAIPTITNEGRISVRLSGSLSVPAGTGAATEGSTKLKWSDGYQFAFDGTVAVTDGGTNFLVLGRSVKRPYLIEIGAKTHKVPDK